MKKSYKTKNSNIIRNKIKKVYQDIEKFKKQIENSEKLILKLEMQILKANNNKKIKKLEVGKFFRCRHCLKNYNKTEKYSGQQCKNCFLEKRRIFEKEKCNKDIQFKLTKNLRSRLHSALKQNTKKGSAIKNLGCTIEELKKHLEKQFEKGMSWDNYGEWEIDHIVPLSSVDLQNKKQLLKIVHFSNLRPMWKLDNLKKGKKVQKYKCTTHFGSIKLTNGELTGFKNIYKENSEFSLVKIEEYIHLLDDKQKEVLVDRKFFKNNFKKVD